VRTGAKKRRIKSTSKIRKRIKSKIKSKSRTDTPAI